MINSSVGQLDNMAKRRATDYIVLHHSGTKRSHKADVHTVHRWHIGQGWDAIGYHFYIEKNGTLRIGRPIGSKGAHVKQFNSVSLGICMEGGLDKDGEVVDNFSPDQYKTLQSLIITLSEIYPKAIVCKHKDLAVTKCSDIDLDKITGRF